MVSADFKGSSTDGRLLAPEYSGPGSSGERPHSSVEQGCPRDRINLRTGPIRRNVEAAQGCSRPTLGRVSPQEETMARRLFVFTALALFALAAPSVVQAQLPPAPVHKPPPTS